MPAQCTLPFRTWGGRRHGAGRKPTGPTAGVPHRPRPVHQAAHPVHITLRVVRGVPSLRGRLMFAALRRSLALASTEVFRIAQFSVQSNHVHFIVEAAAGPALSRGVQGVAIRLARTINRVSGRQGPVWGGTDTMPARCAPREKYDTASSTCC